MSDKIRFIFSTRTLGEGMAFCKNNDLNETSKVRAYLRSHFMKSDDDVLSWLRTVNDNNKQKLEQDFTEESMKLDCGLLDDFEQYESLISMWYNSSDKMKLFNILLNSGVVSEKVKKEISCCPGVTDQEKLKARFSYYSLKNNSTPEKYEAFAVPHLEWTANMDWINALIDEDFGTKNDFGTLYLVLHDNDLPGYEHQPFHILTAEETRNVFYPDIVKEINQVKTEIKTLEGDIEKLKRSSTDEAVLKGKREKLESLNTEYIENRNNEQTCKFNQKYIKIIVFQHTWNDVMRVLKNQNLTLNEIESHLGANKAAVEEIFNPTSTKNFSKLKVDASVDVSQNVIKTDDSEFKSFEIDENRSGYVYEDNGALLTELMHEMTDIHSSKQFVTFIKTLRHQTSTDENVVMSTMRFPLIIKLYTSFFEDWERAVPETDKEKVRSHPNNKAWKENLNRIISFCNNSSIWVRIVDVNNEYAFTAAKNDFDFFEKVGLYDYASAKENLEYNTRIFSENYLVSALGGHGQFVTPIIYGDETNGRDFFLDLGKFKNSEYKKRFVNRNFEFLESNKNDNKDTFKCGDVAMRILVVDDKMGRASGEELSLCCCECKNIGEEKDASKTCGRCQYKDKRGNDLSKKQCKLYTLRELLSGEFLRPSLEDKKSSFDGNTYWDNEVTNYRFNRPLTIKDALIKGIEDLPDSQEKSVLTIWKKWTKEVPLKDVGKFSKGIKGIDDTSKGVQIIGVPDVESALVLMYYFKFDMVFLDYLLAGDEIKREYSTEWFEFLSNSYQLDNAESRSLTPEAESIPIVQKLKTEIKESMSANNSGAEPYPEEIINKTTTRILESFKRKICENRGPVNKYWIMPITGFNDTFISELINKNINLIDYRWNVNLGADPITTPWQFLYAVNSFVDLQLRGCLFQLKELLVFIKYTSEKFRGQKYHFNEFQAIMGAEYSSFMRHYGNMQIIERDAHTNADNGECPILSDKSVFSTFIWKNFYDVDSLKNNKGEIIDKYRPWIGLCRKMRQFYYTAAFMSNDHNGLKRLRESFYNLRYVVEVKRWNTDSQLGDAFSIIADAIEQLNKNV